MSTWRLPLAADLIVPPGELQSSTHGTPDKTSKHFSSCLAFNFHQEDGAASHSKMSTWMLATPQEADGAPGRNYSPTVIGLLRVLTLLFSSRLNLCIFSEFRVTLISLLSHNNEEASIYWFGAHPLWQQMEEREGFALALCFLLLHKLNHRQQKACWNYSKMGKHIEAISDIAVTAMWALLLVYSCPPFFSPWLPGNP